MKLIQTTIRTIKHAPTFTDLQIRARAIAEILSHEPPASSVVCENKPCMNFQRKLFM